MGGEGGKKDGRVIEDERNDVGGRRKFRGR